MKLAAALSSLILAAPGSQAFMPVRRTQSASSTTTLDVARGGVSTMVNDTYSGFETEQVNGGGGLILQNDVKSQLFSSFSALSLADQYDAVLTGLCAKIVDTNEEATEETTQLSDPLQLLQEMNDKRLTASPRSIMALIDATVKAQDAGILSSVMSLCVRNGAAMAYGQCIADIQSLPVTPQTRVKCPDGSIKTRQQRLESVAQIPTDERASEVGAAIAAVALAGGCEMTDFVPALTDAAPAAHLLLSGMFTVGVLDNCYDLIQNSMNFVVGQVGKGNEMAQKFKMPAKDSLPLGLGTGQATGQVVRGMTRLITVDAARDAQAEAAALFVAYSLGLPVFCFRANALEASVLAVDNQEELLSDTGLLRLLMWLMAPVAAESAQYPVLISSDPREAEGFLDRLEQVATNNPDVAQALWWMDDIDGQERKDLMQWAYTEADVLLRDNKKVVQELAERLEGGAATIGDCIAVMERW